MTPIRPPRETARDCPPIPSESLSSATLLARILQGNDTSLPLAASIAQGESLSGALAALPASRRHSLEREFGGHLQSILALAQESQPESLFGSLMEIARDLEIQEAYAGAGRIYMTVVALNHDRGCNPARLALAERAQARLNFFSGQGSWRDYGELFLRQSIDPSDLIAFGVAGITSRTLRFGALSRILGARERFAASRLSPWWTRGAAPRLIAAGVGLGIEAPSFVVASHLSQNLLGRNHDWGAGGLDRELREAYQLFAPTRALVTAASLLVRRRMGITSLRGATIRRRLVHEGAVQLGIIGGLYLAHQAQSNHAEESGDPASVGSLGDSARIYLQFNAMRGPAALFIRSPRIR